MGAADIIRGFFRRVNEAPCFWTQYFSVRIDSVTLNHEKQESFQAAGAGRGKRTLVSRASKDVVSPVVCFLPQRALLHILLSRVAS